MKLYITLIALAVVLALLAGCDEAPAALGAAQRGGRWTGHCWRVQESHALELLGSNISESLPGQFVFLQSPRPKPDKYGQMFWEYGAVFVGNVPAGLSKKQQAGHVVCATRLIQVNAWSGGGGTEEWYEGTFR